MGDVKYHANILADSFKKKNEDGTYSEVGGSSVTVDSALSDTSTNPVQNKVINEALLDKSKATSIAPAYDSTKTYAVDALVTYNSVLYKCTTAVTTAEAWDSTKWESVDVQSYLSSLALEISQKGNPTDEQVEEAVDAYLEEHPISSVDATNVSYTEGSTTTDGGKVADKLTDLAQTRYDSDDYSEVIVDEKGRIIESRDKEGNKTLNTDLTLNGGLNFENMQVGEAKMSTIDIDGYVEATIDDKGRILEGLKEDGTKVIGKIESPTLDELDNRISAVDVTSVNQWSGKVALFYGDSVTAQSNTSGKSAPFDNYESVWASKVAKILNLSKYYCRGIGGATWSPMNKIAYIDANGSPKANSITSYTKETAPAEEGYTIVDGGMACFERMSAQIPESIRESIDLVFMFCHNQEASSFTPSFLASDTSDDAWMASSLNTYGGDYDITDCGNAIVSAIMKMQVICPNARIVIGTGVSGRGDSDASNTTDLTLAMQLQEKQEITRKIANIMSIPCVDVWGTDGINPLVRENYIRDGVHPNILGGQMMAKAIAGGLKNIYPFNY